MNGFPFCFIIGTVSLFGLFALPQARLVRVESTAEIFEAAGNAQPGDTLLIAEGTYSFTRPLQLDGKSHLTLISENGDPETTVLTGKGFSSGDEADDILRIGSSSDILIEKIGFQECFSYGIKVEAEKNPERIFIRNCHFRNIGTRHIKGSTATGTSAQSGEISGCRFENTKLPSASWRDNGNYIAAIDMMALVDWSISDNTFLNVRGLSGEGRAAIFIWVGSRDITVERNIILHCDRGIAFGNPSPSTNGAELHVENAICRNNFILAGPDAGIELAWVDNVKIVHNTIWRPEAEGRGIRSIERISATQIENNLLRGQIQLSGGESANNNFTTATSVFFRNAALGDFHLTASAGPALGQGDFLVEAGTDIDGEARPVGGSVDLGADQMSNISNLTRYGEGPHKMRKALNIFDVLHFLKLDLRGRRDLPETR